MPILEEPSHPLNNWVKEVIFRSENDSPKVKANPTFVKKKSIFFILNSCAFQRNRQAAAIAARPVVRAVIVAHWQAATPPLVVQAHLICPLGMVKWKLQRIHRMRQLEVEGHRFAWHRRSHEREVVYGKKRVGRMRKRNSLNHWRDPRGVEAKQEEQMRTWTRAELT